jgi:GT2 family glycosyltransferase
MTMGQEASPRVTVAVLNYNGRALLEIVLPSLAMQEYHDFQAVVVDNCSTDDSLSYLQERWPDVRVVRTGTENIGVAAALNVALRSADTELVALLNNDIELDPRWLAEMVGALDRHPDASTISCKLRNYWRRQELDGAGDIFQRDGTATRRGHGQLDEGQYDEEGFVFAPSAGAALYRASAIADVGGFDESFWAYYEDVDWGLRAQLRAQHCRYVPSAVAYHMGSATTGGDRNEFYLLLHRRNLLGVLVKDLPLVFLVLNAPWIGNTHLQLLRASARDGLLRVHARAMLAVLRQAPGWLRTRRQIQRNRRIGGAELTRLVREWAR